LAVISVRISPMTPEKRQILLTNDDGIQSPGLWAAAAALSNLGYVTVVAPREQASATGRSLPLSSDGKIQQITLNIGSQEWQVYSVGGSPAQTVLHAVMEIMPAPPDLVVVGINYGENVGTSITMSGTVGAAIQAADLGLPAMAASLQLIDESYLSYSQRIDFSAAAHFTGLLAKMILEKGLPAGVDLFKLEVPASATPQTAWRFTRLAHHPYFTPVVKRSGGWDSAGYIDYRIDPPGPVPVDSDLYALVIDKVVAVTPLTLDMTARGDLKELEEKLTGHKTMPGCQGTNSASR
jgi:5'-nucleotidase